MERIETSDSTYLLEPPVVSRRTKTPAGIEALRNDSAAAEADEETTAASLPRKGVWCRRCEYGDLGGGSMVIKLLGIGLGVAVTWFLGWGINRQMNYYLWKIFTRESK